MLNVSGRLLVFDHAMSAAGILFSRFAHHEKAGFAKNYRLRAQDRSQLVSPRYYADHANAGRILERRFDELLRPAWKKVALIKLPAIKWLLSGGYRGPSFLYPALMPGVTLCERVARLAPSIFALRLLAVLEKSGD